MRRASTWRANYCATKEFWPALRPGRCSRARCVIAGSRRKRSGSSLSSANGEQISLENVQRFLDGRSGVRPAAVAGRFERFDFSHRYEAGEVISVGPDDTLLTAVKRMRAADISQVPVVDENGRAIGILDESDVLVKVHHDPEHFNNAVKTAMTDRLETLSPAAKIVGPARRLRSRPRRHRDGREQVSRADHAKRSAFLSAPPNAVKMN